MYSICLPLAMIRSRFWRVIRGWKPRISKPVWYTLHDLRATRELNCSLRHWHPDGSDLTRLLCLERRLASSHPSWSRRGLVWIMAAGSGRCRHFGCRSCATKSPDHLGQGLWGTGHRQGVATFRYGPFIGLQGGANGGNHPLREEHLSTGTRRRSHYHGGT